MKKPNGKAVRGSSSGKPTMVLLDVLGTKWTLRILWELVDCTFNFRDLRNQCDNISPTILNNRLKELRVLKLVTHNENGYSLTSRGSELISYLLPLHAWAEEWSKEVNS